MLKKIKLTCDKATTICDKNQYGKATVLELIKLNIHFLSCKICVLYTKQNIKMTNLFKQHSSICKQVTHCMTEEEKEVLKKKLSETISK